MKWSHCRVKKSQVESSRVWVAHYLILLRCNMALSDFYTTMVVLDSTSHYHRDLFDYLTLQWLYLNLLESTSLYHSST